MTNSSNNKQYDLEEKTFQFAQDCRNFIHLLPRTISNVEYFKQLTRSASSPVANYIEANESLSKKDFLHRIKICRKESKESRLWLRLIQAGTKPNLLTQQKLLIQEATELTKIFSSILKKSK